MTVLDIQQMGCYDNVFVYLKSEADKVIAELKDIDSKNRSAYYKDLEMMAKDVERHKYKRCLAMADRCRERFHHYVVLVCFSPNKGAIPFYERKRDRAYNWMYKWLELAEKFKEGSDE